MADMEATTTIFEEEELVNEEDGLAIFEAGSYSQGPSNISSEDAEEETFFSLEQCVNW